MHATAPDSHSLHGTIIEKLQKCADWKGGLTTKWRLKTACIIPLVLSTEGIITDRLQESLKLPDFRPAAVCIIMQQFLTVTDFTAPSLRSSRSVQTGKAGLQQNGG
jgi:hypothetical protein